MAMTSFPNYYVINDFIDRTSFLGQMDWNPVQNDIRENYQTNCHLKPKSMTFDVTSGPKITSGICKILKVKTIGFLTSNDLKQPWLTLNDLLLE